MVFTFKEYCRMNQPKYVNNRNGIKNKFKSPNNSWNLLKITKTLY